ncbi:MAG: hypothetical protein EP329_05425 [Deltaproteobacteria bacterium]|nr:MAG: hypothetical protein EP329_05425 [Deltaproteobacteria bacterium]
MSEAKPAGALMTGAIGSFLIAAAILLMFVLGVSFGGGAMGRGSAGGGIIVGLFLLAGGIMSALGWFGLGKLYGGLNSLAGIFSILIAVTILLVVLGGVMMSVGMLQAGMYGILFSIPLTALLGGLGLMGSASKAGNAGLFQAGGIVLLVVGIAGALIAVFALGQMGVGALGEILGYVYIFGGIAGFALAGVAMMGARN